MDSREETVSKQAIARFEAFRKEEAFSSASEIGSTINGVSADRVLNGAGGLIAKVVSINRDTAVSETILASILTVSLVGNAIRNELLRMDLLKNLSWGGKQVPSRFVVAAAI